MISTLYKKLITRLHIKFLIRGIFVLIVGVLCFETISFYRMSSMVQKLTLDNMKASVNAASSIIDDELSRLKTDLKIISELPSLDAFFLNSSYDLMSEAENNKKDIIQFFQSQHVRNSAYLALKVCDRDNRPLLIYSPISEVAENSLNTNCSYNLEKRQPSVVKSKGNLHLLFGQEVSSRSHRLGQIEILFDLKPYNKMISEYSLNESGFLTLLDDNRRLSFSNNSKIAFFEILANEIDKIPTNTFTEISRLDFGATLLYLVNLKEFNWHVAAVVYEDEIFAPLYEQIKLAIIIIIAMILTEAFFLNFFTKRIITDRINQLVDATKSILAGDYGQKLESKGTDEISQLSNSFNQMTEALQEQIRGIKAERDKVVKGRKYLNAISENSGTLINIKGVDGRYQLVNSAFAKYFGREPEEIIGKTDFDLLPNSVAENFRRNDLQSINTRSTIQFEEEVEGIDSEPQYFVTIKFPLFDEKGEVHAVGGIATDISERIKSAKALEKLNSKLKLSNALLESIEEGVIITDESYRIIDANPAFIELFGYSKEELIGRKPKLIRSEVHPPEFYEKLYERLDKQGSWHGEIWEKTKSGETIPQLLTVTSIRNEEGKITNYAGIYADISDLKQTQYELQKQAHFDSLTGLANRILLEERTSQAILLAQRESYKVAMLFIDLDNFKYINDTLGHDIGDELLKQVAKRFDFIIRETDTLARQGGDEFVILLSKIVHNNDARIIAEKIRAAGSSPFAVGPHELYISTSIGIALYPEDALDTNGLLKCSDMAMYAAKDSGKNNFHFYSEALNHAAVDRLKIERALRDAIDNDSLEIYLQPQADSETGQIEKFEALLRWRNEDGQFIAPDLFIPIAEESGIIFKLGNWVVRRAVEAIKQINNSTGREFKLAINLSARQFRHYDLATTLDALVKESGISNHLVEFEVTESLLVEDYKLAEKILAEIKSFGFSLALDDFGTGYSSLSYLKHFPIDTLKLDKLFMKDLVKDKRNQAIVLASIDMGKALGMTVVCEGIESKEQFDFIRSVGEVKIQGYYLSKPEPVVQLLKKLPSLS
ncbi:EAL domain-containing protein [Aliikangiella sp. G2MR2-5]|uniref:EAL domain-containing protein n=1 Tax=Aliikangiella sp. G2MR2-5 TaxID=2788943 RepID=UPI0018A8F72C|nr:EAL domain-containing protein [Aliikangiella sp. G2MR2-5]